MESKDLHSVLYACFQIDKLKYQAKERNLTDQETTAYSNCIQYVDTFLEFNLEFRIVEGFPIAVVEKPEYTYD